jgi:predicted nucleotidyltransferase
MINPPDASGFFYACRVPCRKGDSMQDQQPRIEAALAVARKCLDTRFSGASSVFVAGSIMRGEGTEFSDIDLVVVFSELPRAWRESFVLDGFPVEAFVHDPETLAYFIEAGVNSGTPIVAHMVANGVIIGEALEAADTLRQRARITLEQGPNPLAGEPYDTMRYFMSDLADDLRADRPIDEVGALAALVYPRLIDLILLGRHQWTGKGKWGPRLLRRFDPDLAHAAAKAFVDAVQGNKAALLSLVDQELSYHGGTYFDGYRVEAPLDARRPSINGGRI